MGIIRGAANAASNMILYWSSGSPPCWRVQLCLEEKGLGDYQSKLLSMSNGEHNTKEMLEMNPRAQVPVFKDGKRVISESSAICYYLEDTYKSHGKRLIPDDADKRALVHQRTQEAANMYTVTRGAMTYFFGVPKDKQTESGVREKKDSIRNELLVWEGHLAKQRSRYMAGTDFSMADVAAFPHVAFFVRLGFELGPPHFTCLGSYYDDLKSRPSIQKTWPPHWKNSPRGTLLSDA